MRKSDLMFVLVALLAALALTCAGCGYNGSLLVKDNFILAESNRPMTITRVIDKDGNTSVTYSSKKDSGWFGNLMTIIGLRAANK